MRLDIKRIGLFFKNMHASPVNTYEKDIKRLLRDIKRLIKKMKRIQRGDHSTMRDLVTMHTEIERGNVEFNAPVSYEINHKESGKLAGLIKFQKGPVKEEGLNGIFIEDLLLIAIDQVEHFQRSEFSCVENEDTLRHLRDALASTRARQYERSLRNVQGRNEK